MAKKEKKPKEKKEKPPKPAKAPKAAAPARSVMVAKPKADVYTAMIALALVALMIGCLVLYAEMAAYEFKIRPS